MFDIPFQTSTLFAILGCLLIAFDISRKERNPWMVLMGLGSLGLMALMRLFSGIGIFSSITGFMGDIGIGLWIAAGFLLFRKGKAKPFFVLGTLALVVAGAMLFAGRLLTNFTTPSATPVVEEEVTLLFELGPDDNISEVSALLQQHGVHYERAFPSLTFSMDEDLAQVYLVTGTRSNLDALLPALSADAENIDFAGWNDAVGLPTPIETTRRPPDRRRPIVANDPLAGQQWAHDAINAGEAFALLETLSPSEKATVAILDTGVDGGHEDLNGPFERSPADTDQHGHGTHCAGIAGAATHNELGMASLNWKGEFVTVTSYKALGDDGLGSLESIAQAVIDATRDGADVISMSLGGFAFTPPKVVKDAVEFALERNVIVVAAAGNSNQDAKNHMPSNVEGVITVSAVDSNGRKASFSNTNTSLTRPIAAPGVDILSLAPGNEYTTKSGTSMATPLVSGLLGVMRALNPNLAPAEAYKILHETGTEGADLGKVGRQINAEAALQVVAQEAL